MKTIIRSFEEKDRNSVVELWSACGLVVPWNDPNKDIDRKLKVGVELFLVAEDDGKILGTLMGGYEGHRGWINYLAVAPEHRGAGTGHKLVSALEALLVERGCPKVNLQVRSTNSDVIDYYEKLGYVQDEAVSLGKRLIPDN